VDFLAGGGAGADAIVSLGDGEGDIFGGCTVNFVACAAGPVFPDGLTVDSYSTWDALLATDFAVAGGAGAGGDGAEGQLVPEPGGLALLGPALAWLLVRRRRGRPN